MIEKRPNGTYRVRIYRRGRYVASRTFRRLTDAKAWERRQLDALAAGTWVRPAEADQTVAEWVELWWAGRHAVKPSTTARYRSLLDRHVLPEWGRRPLAGVARSEVQAWATRLAEDRSPSTARQALLLLRGALGAAVDDGVLHRNPAAGVRLPRMPRGEPHPLSHAELRRLADSMPSERDRLMLLVAGYGGLRWGELVALRVADVRAAGRELHLRQATAEVSGVLHVGDLKDHEARVVPLPQFVARDLHSYVTPLMKTARTANRLLFPSSSRTHLRNGNWRRNVLTPACKRARLPTITPHNLRDTAASLAIQAGASVVAVARLLGHESASTTLNHYATLFPSDLADVAAAMDRGARAAMNQARRRQTETCDDSGTDHSPTR